MTYCSLLISFTFNIFILCYIGELLDEQVLNHIAHIHKIITELKST